MSIKKEDPFEGDIPEQFRQSFGDNFFSHCSFCSIELFSENSGYMINKIYRQNECIYEIAYCLDCSQKMRETYSKESLDQITIFFPTEDELKERRMSIILLDKEDKNEKLTQNCVVCKEKKNTLQEGYHEYAYCENAKLGYGIFPYMMCEPCVLLLYKSLSQETLQAYHEFIETHFGLPPEFNLKDEKVSVLFL